MTHPIESPARCPPCGQRTFAYLGEDGSDSGLWKCTRASCRWKQLGKAPDPVVNESLTTPARVSEHRPRPPQLTPEAPPKPGHYKPIPGQFKSVPFRPTDGPRNMPLELIVSLVCARCMIMPVELLSKCRHKRVVLARRLIVALGRGLTRASFPELAQVMSPANAYSRKANHSTAVTVFGKFLEWRGNQVRDLVAKDDPERRSFGELTMDGLYWEIRELINGQENARPGARSDEGGQAGAVQGVRSAC